MKNRTMRFSVVFFAGVAFALGGLSGAQEKLLPPKYQVGKEYTFEIKQKMEIDMSTVGAGKTNMDMMMVMKSVCEPHTVKGQRVVTSTFERISVDTNMIGQAMKFDSADEDSAASPLAAGFTPMLGIELITILDKNDKVIEVKGLEGEAAKLFGAEQLKQMMNPSGQLGIPAAGVARGDSWKNEANYSFGKEIGELEMTLDLNYEKDEEVDGVSCAVINLSANADMKLGDGEQVKVQMKDFKGTMRFDKAGRFLKNGSASGEMTVDMQGAMLPVKIDQEYKVKSIKDVEK